MNKRKPSWPLVGFNHHSRPAVLEEGQVVGNVQELSRVVEKTDKDSVPSEPKSEWLGRS